MKLYVPTGGTQPKFTGMTGTVTVNMNKKNTVKNFSNFINCYNWKYKEKHNRFKSEARNYAENCKYQHEDISVYTVAADGGDSIGSSTTNGSRDIPSDLLNMWHRGSFSSASASLNYHFGKHGSGVGTSNIVSYAQSAKNFKSNLSGAKSSKVNGSTPNVTRWKKNGKYIDICGSKNIGKIISYDRQ